MSTPQRIQRRREKGWRMPSGTVYVGRPSRFGNIERVSDLADFMEPNVAIRLRVARQIAVAFFREHLLTPAGQRLIVAARRELRGKNLACWCPLPAPGEPDLCHAAILLELVNTGA